MSSDCYLEFYSREYLDAVNNGNWDLVSRYGLDSNHYLNLGRVGHLSNFTEGFNHVFFHVFFHGFDYVLQAGAASPIHSL